MKRRLLRIFGIVLVVGLFTGYFVFSTFLFSPFEGGFGPDLSALMPRDVDYYLSKARLDEVFTDFPELAIREDFVNTKGGNTLVQSRWFQDLLRESQLEEGLASLDEALAQSPIDIDILSVFGGSDVAVTGYFGGPGQGVEWAAYGRTNWMGKLGFALTENGWLGLEDQGIQTAESDGVLILEGGQIPQPIYLARIFDVLVASNSQRLAVAALELEGQQGADSLGQSARYHDFIIKENTNYEPEDVEVFVDVRKLLENQGVSGRWPVAEARESTVQTFLAGLFQLSFLREVTGYMGFEGGVRLDLHADLSSELLSSEQKRLYRLNSFGKPEVQEMARYAPEDSVFFLYAKLDPGDTLRLLRNSLDPDWRDLIDDLVRTVWGYADALPLIGELDLAFRNRFGLVVCVLDDRFQVQDDGEHAPRHDASKVYAWTLIGWLDEPLVIDRITEKILQSKRRFGIVGRDPSADGGIYNHTDQAGGGWVSTEFHNPQVPGTGHIAYLIKGDMIMIGNSSRMLSHMVDTYYGDGSRSLRDHLPFSAVLHEQGLAGANILAWANIRAASDEIREMAQFEARNKVFINWDVERPRIEGEISAEHFAGMRRDALTSEQQQRFDEYYSAAADEFAQDFTSQHTRREYAKLERLIQYGELATGSLLQIKLDPKHMVVFLRSMMPLD